MADRVTNEDPSDRNVVIQAVIGVADFFWFLFRPAFIGMFVLGAGLLIGAAFALGAGLVGGLVLQVLQGSWSGVTTTPLAFFILAVGALAMLQTMGNVAQWFGSDS
jgi:hypothetical protein